MRSLQGAAGRIKEKIMVLNTYKGWKEETSVRRGGGEKERKNKGKREF